MWSKKHKKCITCGTTRVKHAGKGMCKNCYARKYRKESPEILKKISIKYRKANRERLKERSNNYRKENPEKLKEYYKRNFEKHKECQRNYRKNSEKYKKYQKSYKKNNFEKHKEYHRIYQYNRKQIDSRYKLKCNISALISEKLRKRLSSKKGKSTFNFLPYTLEDLIRHL